MTTVTVVSSPMDGSCGIGSYTEALLTHIGEEIDEDVVVLETSKQGLSACISYARTAFQVGTTDSDVIHIQHEYGFFGKKWLLLWAFYPIIFVLARLRRRPVVITLHEAWNVDRMDPPLLWLKGVYIRVANEMIVSTATSLVFLSENCKSKFQRNGTVDNYRLFPHGVDEDEVKPIPDQEAKSTFGFDTDDTVITEFGYIRPSKGYETFLEIAERCCEFEFLVAGGNPSEDEYIESLKAAAPDNVTFTGHLNDRDFHAAFSATDVAVLPYNEVAQSGIFSWCAAYELPTVASRLPRFERLHSEYGCPAVFESVDEAERSIRRVLNDDAHREKLTSAIERFRCENNFEEVGDQHEALYRFLA